MTGACGPYSTEPTPPPHSSPYPNIPQSDAAAAYNANSIGNAGGVGGVGSGFGAGGGAGAGAGVGVVRVIARTQAGSEEEHITLQHDIEPSNTHGASPKNAAQHQRYGDGHHPHNNNNNNNPNNMGSSAGPQLGRFFSRAHPQPMNGSVPSGHGTGPPIAPTPGDTTNNTATGAGLVHEQAPTTNTAARTDTSTNTNGGSSPDIDSNNSNNNSSTGVSHPNGEGACCENAAAGGCARAHHHHHHHHHHQYPSRPSLTDPDSHSTCAGSRGGVPCGSAISGDAGQRQQQQQHPQTTAAAAIQSGGTRSTSPVLLATSSRCSSGEGADAHVPHMTPLMQPWGGGGVGNTSSSGNNGSAHHQYYGGGGSSSTGVTPEFGPTPGYDGVCVCVLVYT